MRSIVLFILLSACVRTQSMMQKVKNFICCSEYTGYAKLEKKGNYCLALRLAVEKNNLKRVKKYITQHTFDQEIIKNAFFKLLNEGPRCNSNIIKLLLTQYHGDFIVTHGLWPTHSMLYYACHNTNIETIVALIDADASPIHCLPNEFPIVDLPEVNLGRDDINDRRIQQAISRFRERYYKKLHTTENFRAEIYACVTNSLNIGGEFNPADIVDEYLFEEDQGTKSLRWHDEEEKDTHNSLDVEEPATVHFRSEK